MAASKRDTAEKIEKALEEMESDGLITDYDRFRQYIYLVQDFLEISDMDEALRILNKIDFDFFKTIPLLKNKKDEYSKIAIKIYEYFGLEYCVPQISKIKN